MFVSRGNPNFTDVHTSYLFGLFFAGNIKIIQQAYTISGMLITF